MRILYAIQGTGNGHISRANEIIPALRKRANVDVLISGQHAEVSLEEPVNYRLNGLGFMFGKKGGIDYVKTFQKSNIRRLQEEIVNFPVEKYDLVISDFEPISSWAAKRKHIPCVGLSNQCVLKNVHTPNPPKKFRMGKLVINRYAPVDYAYGYHYQQVNEFISTPVIRKEIRELHNEDKEHYLVYLPFYSDKRILKNLQRFSDTRWVVFSKHSHKGYEDKNVIVHPINKEIFLENLRSCRGVISAAGFGLTTEVLYLGKKLLVIPMKKQYEQHCNALALSRMGVSVMKSLKQKNHEKLADWLSNSEAIRVNYPPVAQKIVDSILSDFARQFDLYQHYITEAQFNADASL